ncbi:class I SAM-dependent methyltransferase [Methylobacterium sp. PvR107]|uniref:class I SAM-dependent methyltransferase n=1 Tax=Methylobacterium sp. PvR107 TaxID=2806597 RepID=UPI001AE32380|nr:class I SAM-dependent methyltransferase [Methylobacterium sp. PvR107]MBP1178521.1 2-polyprenyl-3-methyl-5-hydroxy-6-metoxy-1,4-benzoquinol methylase [Methylobacterium sp. PvR107]
MTIFSDAGESGSITVDSVRPEIYQEGHQRALALDISWLSERSGSFVEVDCPACNCSGRHPLYEKYGMHHVVCDDCGTQYISPRPTPGMLAEFYAQSEIYYFWGQTIYPSSATARKERIFRPRARIIDEICEKAGLVKGGILVEIGAAYGLFCEEIRALGRFDRIVAIEPVPTLAATCREKGFEVIESTVEQVNLDCSVDVACSFEVIEHLFSPLAFMKEIFRLLKPGGHVMLSCPNIKGFDTEVLGARSDTVDHEHLNYFSPASITILAERVGFVDVKVVTPGRLDVEIVSSALRHGLISEDELGKFVSKIVAGPDRAVAEHFQAFLAASGLSSSMLLIARKS